ncbi:hypothetical protein BRC64_10000 [Halobacteriales archaeon QH_10_67_22]|nr:MAG: hypothetical protein BRC64_10000 [Halobacteriales archaeon QH_10_67_22]
MGRMLMGVDLDESPVGGLIERLLSEKELEKLADGGQPAGDDTDASEDGADDIGDDEFDWVTDDVDDTEEWVADPMDDPRDPEFDLGADDDGGRLGGYRPLLLKAAVALAVLAVLAVVAYRYAGRIKGIVPDRLTDRGGDDSESDDAGTDEEFDDDVSPARRRAKMTDDDADRPGRSDPDTEWTTRDEPETEGEDEADVDADDGGVRSIREDVDLGALVGLATLALIAAVVRKFGEERPHDPLVDGPGE